MNKKIFRNFIWLMKYNLSTLFVFELFHKGLALILIWPIIQLFINLSIKRSGYVYLVTENLIKILTNPSSIILMLISIIILGFYMFFEITAVIICIDEARKGNKIKVSKLIVASFKRSLVILNPKNILLFIFVLLIIPLTNLNLTSGLVGSIKVPEYILDYIYSNTILNIIYTIIFLLLYILVSRWIFSIYEITLNTKSFNRAVKESLKFTKGKLIKIILYSISLFTIMYLVGFLINIIGIFLIAVWTKYVTDMNGLKELFISRSIMFNYYSAFIGGIFLFLISIGFFLTIYYEYKGIDICKNKVQNKRRFKKREVLKKFLKLVIIVVVIDIEAFAFSNNSQSIFNLEMFYNTTATAHRGASLLAPENTLAAFKIAADSKAEYAELDVQETKDGQLVITHDSNLKRVTGVNKNVWDANYDEIKKYDAGSHFDENYKGEKMPTLEEVLKFSKGKIKLLIEIKLHGHEKDDVVKKVVDLIKENKMSNQCIIGSMDKNILKEVKKIDPNMITCYITAFAYGDFYDWDFVDIYSIESTFVNETTVDNVHDMGKQIFVWSVNNESEMERLIDLNVDSIITDNPYLVLDTIHWKENNFIKLIADELF